MPLDTPDGPQFPCIGVYTIDGAAAGIYGRLAPKPLIDGTARDVAVLVEYRGYGPREGEAPAEPSSRLAEADPLGRRLVLPGVATEGSTR